MLELRERTDWKRSAANPGEAAPLILNLTAGSHTVRLGYRENLFIDQVELELVLLV